MSSLDDWDKIMQGAFPRRNSTPAKPTEPTKNKTDELDEITKAIEELSKQNTLHLESLTKKMQSDTTFETAFDETTQKMMDELLANIQADGLSGESTENLSTLKTNYTTKSENTSSKTSFENTENIFADTNTATNATADTAKTSQSTDTQPSGDFVGLSDLVKEEVIGQDDFVMGLVRAFRRPFLTGSGENEAKNTIFISGGIGTGRHFALSVLCEKMAERKLLKSKKIAELDLTNYPDGGAEKIFLQDLFAVLNGKSEVVVIENYENAHPAFLKTLTALVCDGEATLNERYLLNKDGVLISAGTALSAKVISTLSAKGKYFIVISQKGKNSLADKFGARFVTNLGDSISTESFSEKACEILAKREFDKLSAIVFERLKLTLTATDDVLHLLANSVSENKGMFGMKESTEKIFRALSEHCLASEVLVQGKAELQTVDTTLYFSVNNSESQPLFALLPARYDGSLKDAEKALDKLVGLSEVKDFVRALADNVAVQKRRESLGHKTSSLSMHTIYSGNPGTGKTTIARIVAQYLKAIGALSGGQLVEVSRGDLVGRYSGHTAPLTNSVIESALGGVLFIDEAYSLYRGEQDSFGLEAIDTLVKGMEDNRDNLVVVLAGYTNEMQEFLTANSGLASRFSRQIEFPDYSAEELFAITELQTKGKGYTLDSACKEPLLRYYAMMQSENADTAGNGRLARNTLEKAILNQSRRLVAKPNDDMNLLVIEDFDI